MKFKIILRAITFGLLCVNILLLFPKGNDFEIQSLRFVAFIALSLFSVFTLLVHIYPNVFKIYKVEDNKINIWDGDLETLSRNKIYAYCTKDGSIYKTMELSIIGNCDVSNNDPNTTYVAFIRLDNSFHDVQFQFHNMKHLFRHHLLSLDSSYTVYEFSTQEEFINWCHNQPIHYK